MRIIALIFLVLALMGCSTLSPVTIPQKNTYVLDTPGNVQPSKQNTNKVLQITKPAADPGYQTQKIAYTEQPHTIDYFSYNEWVVSPSEMLLPVLTETMQKTRYFKAVLRPADIGKADLRLDTRWIVLRQEFIGTESHVNAVIQASLIDTAQQNLLATKQFTAKVRAQTNTPEAGVIAANQAVSQLLSEIAQFVIKEE